MKRLIALLLLLLPSLAGTARAEIVERIIVKVNGEIVTLSEFHERQIAAAQAADTSSREEVAAFLRQNNAKLLQEAIDEILLIQRAVDGGMGLRPEFVDEIVESVKTDNNIETEEQFQAALASEGMTLDDLRKSIEKNWTKRMIIQKEVEPRITVTEEEIQAEYEKHKAGRFTKSATVTLQEIVVSEDTGGLPLAVDIVARARAGEDFASLARTHSAGATAGSGGDLGEIAQGDLSPDLEEIAFGLAVGAVSDPIVVERAHRIIRVVAKTTGSVVPYATAKKSVRNYLMSQRFDTEYEAFMKELRDEAVIDLRVREVPLQLTGAIPEGTLLDVDPFSMGSPVAGAAPPAGAQGTPTPGSSGSPVSSTANPFAAPAADDEFVTSPQAAPERIVPGAEMDEISTTPQARPERVAPPSSTSTDSTESAPPQ